MTAVLALSLSSQIEKYGAYAGMAAIVGLGVLSLLYFAQAREVKRLREWAGRAPERDAELQQRAVAEAQRRAVTPAARPQPARPGGPATPAAVAAAAAKAPQQPATPGAPGTQPGTPTGPKPPVPATAAAAAGVTAAAVTASGKPAPAGAAPVAPGAPATTPAVTPAKPGPAQPAVAAAATAPPSAMPAKPAGTDQPAGDTAPPAPTTSGDAATPAEPPAAKPAAPPAAVSTPTSPPQAPPRPRPRPAAAPVRATRPEGPVTPREGTRPPAQHGSRRGLLAVVVGTIAIVAIAALLITQVFNGDDSPTTQQPNSVGTPTTPADDGDGGTAAKPQPKRETTQVAVFNGTTVTGLARAAADKLTTAGYKNVSPVTTDTTNQARATTVVYWQSGSRREGVDVAKLIGVSKNALQPMDQNARVLGGGAPVVVIVGADQAQ